MSEALRYFGKIIEHKMIVAIVLAAILIGCTATLIFYSYYNYYEVREVEMVLEVAQKLGLNANKDKINFGANFPGNSCRRFMDLSFPRKAKVFIEFDGPLGEWVGVDDNGFVIEPGEIKHLTFMANIPSDAKEGAYSGVAKFYFKRP